jgi:hypothetical protein
MDDEIRIIDKKNRLNFLGYYLMNAIQLPFKSYSGS